MPGEKFDHKPFLSIIGGIIRQQVDPDTKGAVRRDYETPSGKKGTKYELVYRNWEGRVQDIVIKENDFGKQLHIKFNDAILSINCDSRYFVDIVKKLRAVDINKKITIAPYDFEPDGKRKTGVVVVQDHKKVQSFYDQRNDDGTYETINDFPVPEGDTKTFSKDDWKIYFLKVKNFLVLEVDEIRSSIESAKFSQTAEDRASYQEEAKVEAGEKELATDNPAKTPEQPDEIPVKEDEPDSGEVKLSDIPF